MVINKIGQQHIDYGTNCQDYGIEFDGMKVVCDGCSEGKHSEVGAKAFCHLLKNDSVYILPQPLLERYLVYSGRLPAQSEISFVLRSLWLLKMRHISWWITAEMVLS